MHVFLSAWGDCLLDDDDRFMRPAPIVAREEASPLRLGRGCRLAHGARHCIPRIGSRRMRRSRSQSVRFALGSEPRHPYTKPQLESSTESNTGLRLTSIVPECHGIAPRHQTADPPSRLARSPGSRDGICSSGRTRIGKLDERGGWAPGCSRSRSLPIRQSGWRDRRPREKDWRIHSR